MDEFQRRLAVARARAEGSSLPEGETLVPKGGSRSTDAQSQVERMMQPKAAWRTSIHRLKLCRQCHTLHFLRKVADRAIELLVPYTDV